MLNCPGVMAWGFRVVVHPVNPVVDKTVHDDSSEKLLVGESLFVDVLLVITHHIKVVQVPRHTITPDIAVRFIELLVQKTHFLNKSPFGLDSDYHERGRGKGIARESVVHK